jgi:ribonuclease HII
MLLTHFSNLHPEAGTDEAGRGCLAGPVTAAAVINPSNTHKNKKLLQQYFSLLNDSKQLSEKTREQLRPIIEEIALSFSVTHVEQEVIDEINILNASMKAMQECILKLKVKPENIIVDGNRPLVSKNSFTNKTGTLFTPSEIDLIKSIPSTSVIKGDSKYISIAAASVLAKTYRDDYMNAIHEEFPMYNWKKNKGYPTIEHRAAIKKYGITKYHRISFKLLPEDL